MKDTEALMTFRKVKKKTKKKSLKNKCLEQLHTIEIRSEVAVIAFHELLYCWQKLGVVPFTPVVAMECTAPDKSREK